MMTFLFCLLLSAGGGGPFRIHVDGNTRYMEGRPDKFGNDICGVFDDDDAKEKVVLFCYNVHEFEMWLWRGAFLPCAWRECRDGCR